MRPRTKEQCCRALSLLRIYFLSIDLHGERQPPVSTAARSLWWRVATEQVGVGFVDLDELNEIVDAGACEGCYRLFTGTEDGETACLPGPFR